MAHIIDENISVVNVTRVEMLENRQAIKKIIGSLSLLDYKIGNITQALEREIFQVCQFLQLNLPLYSVIQAIRRTIWQAGTYMEHTVTIKHLIFRSPFTCSYKPKRFEETPHLKWIQRVRFGNSTRPLLLTLCLMKVDF